jgi:hypothetical protein
MKALTFVKTGTLQATTDQLQIHCAEWASVGVYITGTFSGTLSFYGKAVDDGSINDKVAVKVFDVPTGVGATTQTAAGYYIFPCAGFNTLLVKFSAWSSGSANVVAVVSDSPYFVGGLGGDASAANQTATQAAAGSDASVAVAVQGVTNGKPVPVIQAPSSLSTAAYTTTRSAGVVSSLVGKASAGNLGALFGYNSKSSSQYILVFNAASVPADADTTAVMAIPVAAKSNFYYSPGQAGATERFSTGICACNSSTDTAKTIGSADCLFTFMTA